MGLTLVVDIDGTICSLPDTSGGIEGVKPIKDRIDIINKLHSDGNIIIYFTARGMSNDNPKGGKIDKSVKKLTKKQLKDWGAEYDYLVFGKPNADAYIDDKSVPADNFFDAAKNKLEEGKR